MLPFLFFFLQELTAAGDEFHAILLGDDEWFGHRHVAGSRGGKRRRRGIAAPAAVLIVIPGVLAWLHLGMRAVFSWEEFRGDPAAMFDAHFAALNRETVEDGLPVNDIDDVVGVVIDDVEGLFEEDFRLGFLGQGIHFAKVGVFAQPAEDRGDAGHIRGGANLDERLWGRGDAFADEDGEFRVVARGTRARLFRPGAILLRTALSTGAVGRRSGVHLGWLGIHAPCRAEHFW